jgi:hypothetical protein
MVAASTTNCTLRSRAMFAFAPLSYAAASSAADRIAANNNRARARITPTGRT